MNGKELYNITLETGGYTAKPKNRYSVAIKNICKVHKNNKKYIINTIDFILTQDCSFGLWLNDEDENIYIDIVQTYESEKEALEVGRKNLELSIYDLEEQEVIWIDYSK